MIILKASSQNGITLFEKAQSSNSPLIFPTDTIYGIGSFINNLVTNTKIYDIKGREINKPFPLLIGNLKQLSTIIDYQLTEEYQNILNNIWPGSFTVIFKAKKDLNSLFTLNGNVAIRLTSAKWLRDVINHFDVPLSATSANLSGEPYNSNITKIIQDFQNKVDYFLTTEKRNSEPSTILDFSTNKLKFIRNPKNLLLKDLLQ